MRRHVCLWIGIAALSTGTAHALPAGRPVSPAAIRTVDAQRRMDINRANLFVTNHGSIAWDLTTGNPGLYFPTGTTNSPVFAAGLWLGARVAGASRVALAEYGFEFGPGRMIGGTFDDPNRPEYRVWKVAAWRGFSADTSHLDLTPFPPDPTRDPIAHHSWSEYVNGAAPYGAPTRLWRLPVTTTPDPSDSVDVLGPAVTGDLMTWSVFNDADPGRHTSDAGSTLPLGVEVEHVTFAYDRLGPLGNTIFMRYRIRNRGSLVLDSLYAGMWSDPDVGGAGDDRVGCDVARSLAFGYNDGAPDMIYGDSIPVVGFDLLARHFNAELGTNVGMDAFRRYIGGTDPSTVFQIDQLLHGFKNDGSPVVDPTTGLVTRFELPGDPLTGTGWIDSSGTNVLMVGSSGPHTLAPGDSLELWVAIVIGQGDSSPASFAQMLCDDDYAQTVFDQGFAEPFPTPPACPMELNCPWRADRWAAECAAGGTFSAAQWDSLAMLVDRHSNAFDWQPAGTERDSLCATLAAAGTARERARREFAAMLANALTTRYGLHPSVGDAPALSGLSASRTEGVSASTISELIQTAPTERTLRSADYLNDNPARRRALQGTGSPALPLFQGGAGFTRALLGSGFDPIAERDSFVSATVRFDATLVQFAYRFLRLEQTNGDPPLTGPRYRYGGFRLEPFRVRSAADSTLLDIAVVERAVTDANGTLLAPAAQPATFDSLWRPDVSATGGHEYLIVSNRPYLGGPRAELASDDAILDPALPWMYVLWSRLRGATDYIDDGDGFAFRFDFPLSRGADFPLWLYDHAPPAGSDPDVVYYQLTEGLGAINRGEGIGALCTDVTHVVAVLESSHLEPGRVTLTWQVSEPSIPAFVERRMLGATFWTPVGALEVGADGRVTFTESGLEPGQSYDFRLAVNGGVAGQISIVLPIADALRLSGFSPNPGPARPSVTFTLAVGGAVRLELFDLHGRRVHRTDLPALAPGIHTLPLTGVQLEPGVYVVRLIQGGTSVTAKGVIVR